MNQNLLAEDANLYVTGNLPTATATTTSTALLDLTENAGTGVSAGADQFVPQRVNFILKAPALATGQLPDTDTVTYSIWSSPNSDGSSAVEYIPSALVQTGAGGAGAAAVNFTFALPANILRYLFAKATTGAGAAASANTVFALAARF
jgi:hypothetical protein